MDLRFRPSIGPTIVSCYEPITATRISTVRPFTHIAPRTRNSRSRESIALSMAQAFLLSYGFDRGITLSSMASYRSATKHYRGSNVGKPHAHRSQGSVDAGLLITRILICHSSCKMSVSPIGSFIITTNLKPNMFWV